MADIVVPSIAKTVREFQKQQKGKVIDGIRFTRDQLDKALDYLDKLEAEKILESFKAHQQRIRLAVKHGREIPTKRAPWSPRIRNF